MKARTRDELEIKPRYMQVNAKTGHKVGALGAWAGPGYELQQDGYLVYDYRFGCWYPQGKPAFRTKQEAEEWILRFLDLHN
jgi:hypothetical protein